jgi:hypothetical protein
MAQPAVRVVAPLSSRSAISSLTRRYLIAASLALVASRPIIAAGTGQHKKPREPAKHVPVPFLVSTRITLPDLTNSISLIVPVASMNADHVQLLNFGWDAHGGRGDFVTDPQTGGLLLRVMWAGGKRARFAEITQTIMPPSDATDSGKRLQALADRIAKATVSDPPSRKFAGFTTVITPPLPTPPIVKTKKHPSGQ